MNLRRWFTRGPLWLLPEAGDTEMVVLWDRAGPLSLAKVGLSDELRHELLEWAEAFESEPSASEYEQLVKKGRAHARALATFLGRSVIFDEITYSP